MNSDVRTLIRKLKKQGFDVSGGGRRHYKVTNEQGETVVLGSTPSNGGYSAAVHSLKKIGYKP
jgi:hypothetical protein